MHTCVTCRESLSSEAGVPCSFCGGWFHLARNTTEGGLSCGRRSLNFLQEGVCGTLYLCRECDTRLATQGSGAATAGYEVVE